MSDRYGNAYVLCPGPSLVEYFNLDPQVVDEARYVIAVDRAGNETACEAWTTLDLHAAHRMRPLGEPVICLPRRLHVPARAVAGFPGSARPWFDTDRLEHLAPRALRWRLYSETVALLLAAEAGVSRVEVYGLDWSATHDWDGQRAIWPPDTRVHGPAVFAAVAEHLRSAHGVDVAVCPGQEVQRG